MLEDEADAIAVFGFLAELGGDGGELIGFGEDFDQFVVDLVDAVLLEDERAAGADEIVAWKILGGLA